MIIVESTTSIGNRLVMKMFWGEFRGPSYVSWSV